MPRHLEDVGLETIGWHCSGIDYKAVETYRYPWWLLWFTRAWNHQGKQGRCAPHWSQSHSCTGRLGRRLERGKAWIVGIKSGIRNLGTDITDQVKTRRQKDLDERSRSIQLHPSLHKENVLQSFSVTAKTLIFIAQIRLKLAIIYEIIERVEQDNEWVYGGG